MFILNGQSENFDLKVYRKFNSEGKKGEWELF